MSSDKFSKLAASVGRVFTLSLGIIAALLFGMAYTEEHQTVFIAGFLLLAVAMSVDVFLVGSIMRKRLKDQEDLVKRTQTLIEQQEKSGKMLIRRDLELSRANDRLRELDQLKSDFVTIATHQLRTPLSAVKWILSMLIKGDSGELNTEQRMYLMKAYESNDRMTQLLNDMLLADRVESDKMKVDTEVTRVGDLLENLLTEMKPIADNKKIVIDIHNVTIDRNVVVAIDPRLMRAILQNLVENAIKYTKPEGHVSIALHENGSGSITFSVTDDGIGIGAEQQKKIFDRFYRADNALKMVPDGSGLGLFIVKRIIEKSRGKIWFESQEGMGTTFYVELPTASSLPAGAHN